MKALSRTPATLGLLAAAAAATAAAAEIPAPPPLEAFARAPAIAAIDLSADGARVALIDQSTPAPILKVIQASDGALVYRSSMTGTNVRRLEWAGSQKLLAISEVTSRPWGLEGGFRDNLVAASIDVKSGQIDPLMSGAHDSLNTILGVPAVFTEGGHVNVYADGIFFPDRHGVVALYRNDLDDHGIDRIAEGGRDTRQFIAAPGSALARVDYNRASGLWSLSVRQGLSWRTAYSVTALVDAPRVLGLSPDLASVLVLTHEAAGGWSVHAASLKTASWSAPLTGLAPGDFFFDPVTRAAIGTAKATLEGADYTFLSPQDQKTWDLVVRAFPGEAVTPVSWSSDHKHLVVRVEGPRNGAGYFVVDAAKGTARWVADVYAGLDGDNLPERRPFSYPAADGLAIPAYLTLPRLRDPKGLALVVLVHPGPTGRDAPGFDWLAQALASRGYAVLQPEFRGSTGFGDGLRSAGFGELGEKMQSDLSDGVRALAQAGTIDPGRVCVMGAGYGGYAALAAAISDPPWVRCAVSVNGVSNLKAFLDDKDQKAHHQDGEMIRAWERLMGASSRADPRLEALSPALHAERAAAPVLLIHAADDVAVPAAQSQDMDRSLKAAGKDSTLLLLPGDQYILEKPEGRLALLNAAVGFLERTDPPRQGVDTVRAESPTPSPHTAPGH